MRNSTVQEVCVTIQHVGSPHPPLQKIEVPVPRTQYTTNAYIIQFESSLEHELSIVAICGALCSSRKAIMLCFVAWSKSS